MQGWKEEEGGEVREEGTDLRRGGAGIPEVQPGRCGTAAQCKHRQCWACACVCVGRER